IRVERIYGPEHPIIIQTLAKIGLRQSTLGHDADAIATLRQATALADRVLPPRHPRWVDTHHSLGLALLNHADYAPAAAEYERLLPIAKEVYGVDHPRYAVSLGNLALAYHGLGRVDEALRVFHEVLALE